MCISFPSCLMHCIITRRARPASWIAMAIHVSFVKVMLNICGWGMKAMTGRLWPCLTSI